MAGGEGLRRGQMNNFNKKLRMLYRDQAKLKPQNEDNINPYGNRQDLWKFLRKNAGRLTRANGGDNSFLDEYPIQKYKSKVNLNKRKLENSKVAPRCSYDKDLEELGVTAEQVLNGETADNTEADSKNHSLISKNSKSKKSLSKRFLEKYKKQLERHIAEKSFKRPSRDKNLKQNWKRTLDVISSAKAEELSDVSSHVSTRVLKEKCKKYLNNQELETFFNALQRDSNLKEYLKRILNDETPDNTEYSTTVVETEQDACESYSHTSITMKSSRSKKKLDSLSEDKPSRGKLASSSETFVTQKLSKVRCKKCRKVIPTKKSKCISEILNVCTKNNSCIPVEVKPLKENATRLIAKKIKPKMYRFHCLW